MNTDDGYQYKKYSGVRFLGLLLIAWWAANYFNLTVFIFQFTGKPPLTAWAALVLGIACFIFATDQVVTTHRTTRLLVIESRSTVRLSILEEIPFQAIKKIYATGKSVINRSGRPKRDTMNSSVIIELQDGRKIEFVKYMVYDDAVRLAGDLEEAVDLEQHVRSDEDIDSARSSLAGLLGLFGIMFQMVSGHLGGQNRKSRNPKAK